MKKYILICLLTAMVVSLNGCGQKTAKEESSLSEISSNSSTFESSNTSETSQASYIPPADAVIMFNGDTVGPFYKEKYYDVLNSTEYSYTLKNEKSEFKIAHKGMNYYIKFKTEEADYSILLKDHNCYVISDEEKTATLVTLGESDLKSLIDTQFFSGLQYINTTDGKYKGKNCKVEKYYYNKSDDYLQFYYVDDKTIYIEDINSNAVVSDISTTVSAATFNIPKGYKIISLPEESQ